MEPHTVAHRTPPATGAGLDHGEELLAEVDEPPDERRARLLWSPSHPALYDKAAAKAFQRRESLLTRQLHSETEHTDEEMPHAPPRALSTQSTWSNPSTASTAELTSDDGRSVASPAISPSLPPTILHAALPLSHKTLSTEPRIVGQDNTGATTINTPAEEPNVQAVLGRKRCISFACGGKDTKPAPPAPVVPQPEVAAATSPPKRKCALKFVCPTRMSTGERPNEANITAPKRPSSPPPNPPRPSTRIDIAKTHRGSDSTVTHSSPKASRRSPAILTTAPTPTSAVALNATRRFSNDESDAETEATRFHEFASSDGEPGDWVQESTCHRSRLTVTDTLKKETVLSQACAEVEEEAIAEEDDLLDEVEDDQEDESDDGFHTDDEEGFADSDSEAEDSDEEWWRPGALSTAATSIEHLDRLAIQDKVDHDAAASSYESACSNPPALRSFKARPRRKPRVAGMAVHKHTDSVDLPDSTDFVCGTLDEDRPLEQAYLESKKQRETAMQPPRPQDIDPTFPTSDPETDDEDEDHGGDSESDESTHDHLDELDGDLTARRRGSPRARTVHRSPPPPLRHRSPPPPKKSTARSPLLKRRLAHSPPPRKLFGRSPRRAPSPVPTNRMTSPPNTRRSSPASRAIPVPVGPFGLGSRPQLTHTASLPRGGLTLSQLGKLHDDDDGSDEADAGRSDYPKRGAIDIVKGLEQKRQRRKEKLYQKACAKAAAKGEKAYKVKPGQGAQRMREVGLELQRYKGGHILSM